jgi:hypothetical protein
MGIGGWTLLGVGVLGVVWLADWWSKQGAPPPTSLRCTNCPKLTARVRSLQLVAISLLVLWLGTLGYAWLKP